MKRARPDPRPEDETRVDLHVHGQWSPDAIGDLDRLAQAGCANGLNGIALTEHNTTRHHAAIHQWNHDHANDPFRFYPGIEVSTRQGHLLAIGVREDIAKGQDIEPTIEQVTAAGGIAIPAHPHRRFTGIGARQVARVARSIRVLETWNAQETPTRNHRSHRLADTHRLAGTGGSDAHQIHDVANAYTILTDPVDDLDALLDQLNQAKTRATGGRTRWTTRVRQRARIARRLITLRYP